MHKYLDNFQRKFSQQSGFTLIELLIVIAIIGILSTLLMTNFIGVRQRARDAQRKSDVRQMQSALELYRSDTGSYPVSDSNNRLNATACTTSSGFTSTDGGTTYMQKVPCDPLGTSAYHSGNYYYNSSGTTYTIYACLENTSDSQGTSLSNTGCSTDFLYVVTNP
ncbi:MAG TPA: type II secretion system protein [Patescibacteria group bacterium]|nr:type II secretion system protein [Patescibacteria group bacterium]